MVSTQNALQILTSDSRTSAQKKILEIHVTLLFNTKTCEFIMIYKNFQIWIPDNIIPLFLGRNNMRKVTK